MEGSEFWVMKSQISNLQLIERLDGKLRVTGSEFIDTRRDLAVRNL
jgi:hypothetical protein